MDTSASRKRILITGASRGIGRETALMLARGGHVVVLAARDERALTELASEIADEGGRAEVLVVDLTDDTSVQRAVRTLLAGGPCDVLVNNAGRCDQTELLLQSQSSQRRDMEVNYWGALRITSALLPALIRRGAGLIVNVSSLLGTVAAPTTVNYGASKAALEAWSHGLRAEVARFGIRVTVFVAPHTDTEMGRAVKWDGIVSLPVSYTAKQLVRAIDRAPRVHPPGPVYRLFLWLARFAPAFMEARVGAGTRCLLAADPLASSPPANL